MSSKYRNISRSITKGMQKRVHTTEAIRQGVDSKVQKDETGQFISLYGKRYDIDAKRYRVIDHHFRYNGHFGFKVYDSAKCMVRYFSPFHNKFEDVC